MSAHFFETSARSAIGLVRQGNEDSAFTSAQLIAVADGMGGHAAGEDASRIAVQVLQKLAPTLAATDIDEDSVEDLLMHSLHSIDAEIAAATDEEIEAASEKFHAQWIWVLDQMIWSFEQEIDEENDYKNYYDPYEPGEIVEGDFLFSKEERLKTGKFNAEKCKAYNERKQLGFTLFGKYYQNLWD